jgi:hypothetical protein
VRPGKPVGQPGPKGHELVTFTEARPKPVRFTMTGRASGSSSYRLPEVDIDVYADPNHSWSVDASTTITVSCARWE